MRRRYRKTKGPTPLDKADAHPYMLVPDAVFGDTGRAWRKPYAR